MALHRDIYWVGRQWAVTGSGVQAVDQRLKGAFDIDASNVWDEALSQRLRGHAWVNVADFDRALALARGRFPEPARKPLPAVESVLEMIQQPSSAPLPQPASRHVEVGPQIGGAAEPADLPRPAPVQPLLLQLRTQGALARFVPQWRIRR